MRPLRLMCLALLTPILAAQVKIAGKATCGGKIAMFGGIGGAPIGPGNPFTAYTVPNENVGGTWPTDPTPLIYPVPATAPTLGASGTYVTDTTIANTRIMRLTDDAVRTALTGFTTHPVIVPYYGDRNVWARDNSAVLLVDEDGGAWKYVKLNVSNWPNSNTIVSFHSLTDLVSPSFSYVNPDYIYGLHTTNNNFARFKLSDQTITDLFDIRTLTGWPAGVEPQALTVSVDDGWMCARAGVQDSGNHMGCWNQTNSDTALIDLVDNTVNGSPMEGYTGGFAGCGVHAMTLGTSTRYLYIGMNGCTSAMNDAAFDLGSPYHRTAHDGQYYDHQHGVAGTNGYFRADMAGHLYCPQSGVLQASYRAYGAAMSDPATWVKLWNCITHSPGEYWGTDEHHSWHNNGQTTGNLIDAVPVLSLWYLKNTADHSHWLDSEVVGIKVDPTGASKRVWHFFHHYGTPYNVVGAGCNAYMLTAHVSRDGRWAVFNSDWLHGDPTVSVMWCGTYMFNTFLAELK